MKTKLDFKPILNTKFDDPTKYLYLVYFQVRVIQNFIVSHCHVRFYAVLESATSGIRMANFGVLLVINLNFIYLRKRFVVGIGKFHMVAFIFHETLMVIFL